VVNVGERQAGRLRGANVIDVPAEKEAVLAGIRKAVDPTFKQAISGLENPYDQGDASEIIVKVLRDVPLDQRLIQKRFVDSAATAASLTDANRA
jgi:UDP-N-acetylglucosamine 2-epimerase